MTPRTIHEPVLTDRFDRALRLACVERKSRYVDHLARADAGALVVSAADKLYNARAILADYRELGDELWERFGGDKAEILWYCRALADAFSARDVGGSADELDRVVSEIERLDGSEEP